MTRLLPTTILCTILSAASAGATIVGFTFTGVTTTNVVETGAITDEFPIGTPWTARAEWDTGSAPLFLGENQGQFRLTKFTLTLTGQTGTWTSSALPDKASFTLNEFGGSDEIQFTTSFGPANHTNPTIENWDLYNFNVILKDPSGTAITNLGTAPDGIDLSKWSPLVADSQLKIYLNNDANRYILGSIDMETAAKAPEIDVKQAGKALKDGKSRTNFGGVKVGKSGSAKTYIVKNLGDAALKKLQVSIAGKNKKDFKLVKLKNTSLAPGKSA